MIEMSKFNVGHDLASLNTLSCNSTIKKKFVYNLVFQKNTLKIHQEQITLFLTYFALHLKCIISITYLHLKIFNGELCVRCLQIKSFNETL